MSKKSSSTPEIFSQFFMTNLLDLFFFFPPFDCGLNNTDDAFSGKTNIYQKVF